ncbi:hypothetical protein ACJJTC_015100 [Scirpophaga incertulas]
MLFFVFLFIIFSSHYVTGQFGSYKQDFGYVTVRDGAHMFYWLYYTTAPVDHFTKRPLMVWLQERNTTWIKNFNVLFVDNPVGTGYSYVDDLNLLTTTNDEIAVDFVNLMRGFYKKNKKFEGVPLYICGQSYGGKMAVDIAIKLVEAEKEGSIRSNLRGFGMGNSWISPVDSTNSWGPILLAAGLVGPGGYDSIMTAAKKAEDAFNEGLYVNSTTYWADTQREVFRMVYNVNFYNIFEKTRTSASNRISQYERLSDMVFYDKMPSPTSRQEILDLNILMNTRVKEALNIPNNVKWGSQSDPVFNALMGDFMKPVTKGIEKLLNETDLIITKYNGNSDLICATPGQIKWVERLQWDGAEGFKKTPRHPVWVDNNLEGYYKSYGNFRFFWVQRSGHSVPEMNPAATSAFLRDMTSFG